MSTLLSTADDLPEFSAGGIVDLLLSAAQRQPNTRIYAVDAAKESDAAFITYSALLREAQCIRGGLHASGLLPRSHVVLWIERPLDFLPAFWGCVLGGYVPCPLASIRNDPARWAKHVAYIDGLLDRPLFVTTRDRRCDLPTEVSSADVNDLRRSAPLETAYQTERSESAIVVLTSGSTGNSKAVVLTHENFISSMASKADMHQENAKLKKLLAERDLGHIRATPTLESSHPDQGRRRPVTGCSRTTKPDHKQRRR